MAGTATCAVLAAVVLVQLQLSSAWIRVDKPCDPACTKNGNCNKEFGVCECPPEFAGPDCTRPVLSACRSNLLVTDSVPYHGHQWPRSCECLRQIRTVFHLPLSYDAQPLPSILHHPTLTHWNGTVCYERTTLTKDQQYSDVPDIHEPNVDYYMGVVSASGAYELQKLDGRPTVLSGFHDKGDYVPLNRCLDRCNDRGACYQEADRGFCECGTGWKGFNCSEPEYLVGTANCMGRGKLVGSWCHCQEGFWGQECGRSAAWGPDPARPEEQKDQAFDRIRLKIFKYDFPWLISSWEAVRGNMGLQSGYFYGVENIFIENLLNDPKVYTENPYEANLFLVAGDFFHYGNNVLTNQEHVRFLMYWIQQHYPVTSMRHRGKDHVIIIDSDSGACTMTDGVAARVIKVSLWGPIGNSALIPYRTRTYNKLFGDACYNPARDVVVPVPDGYYNSGPDWHEIMQVKDGHVEREYLVFWAGGFQGDNLEYSGGARHEFAKHFLINRNASRYPSLIKYNGDFKEYYHKAHFCLVFAGTGFPHVRLTYAFLTGCIPVIIMDYVYQPFHDLLPYRTFSIRISHEEIPQLLQILGSISEADRAHLRRNMYQYHRYFDWHTQQGGLAYHGTILSLHRRLQNLWSVVYRRSLRGTQESPAAFTAAPLLSSMD